MRAAKDRTARVRSPPPPHTHTLWGDRGRGTDVLSWQQMAGAQAQEVPLPPRSRPPTPRALAIWRAGTVVEAQCPAQHSQACSAASYREE